MSRNGICNFSCSVFYTAVPDCLWTEHFALTTELTSFLLNSYCYKGRKKNPRLSFFLGTFAFPTFPSLCPHQVMGCPPMFPLLP